MKIENPTWRLNAHISTKTANSGGNCVENFMRRERWKIFSHWFVSFPTFLFDIFHLSMIARSFMGEGTHASAEGKSWSCSFTRSTRSLGVVCTQQKHSENFSSLCATLARFQSTVWESWQAKVSKRNNLLFNGCNEHLARLHSHFANDCQEISAFSNSLTILPKSVRFSSLKLFFITVRAARSNSVVWSLRALLTLSNFP